MLKFLLFTWNPLAWVMEVRAVITTALTTGGGKPPDWQDFTGIVTFLLINSTISYIEENNASNVVAALMAHLSPRAKVLRDGHSSEVDASILVPGDIISIKFGDIVAADACLLDGDPLKMDQPRRKAFIQDLSADKGRLTQLCMQQESIPFSASLLILLTPQTNMDIFRRF